MVTCLHFAANVKLLFSGSIDNTVGIWTEKGINLQVGRLQHSGGVPTPTLLRGALVMLQAAAGAILKDWAAFLSHAH